MRYAPSLLSLCINIFSITYNEMFLVQCFCPNFSKYLLKTDHSSTTNTNIHKSHNHIPRFCICLEPSSFKHLYLMIWRIFRNYFGWQWKSYPLCWIKPHQTEFLRCVLWDFWWIDIINFFMHHPAECNEVSLYFQSKKPFVTFLCPCVYFV